MEKGILVRLAGIEPTTLGFGGPNYRFMNQIDSEFF